MQRSEKNLLARDNALPRLANKLWKSSFAYRARIRRQADARVSTGSPSQRQTPCSARCIEASALPSRVARSYRATTLLSSASLARLPPQVNADTQSACIRARLRRAA